MNREVEEQVISEFSRIIIGKLRRLNYTSKTMTMVGPMLDITANGWPLGEDDFTHIGEMGRRPSQLFTDAIKVTRPVGRGLHRWGALQVPVLQEIAQTVASEQAA